MLRFYHPCLIETIPNPTCFFHWHISILLNCRIDSLSNCSIFLLANWHIVSLNFVDRRNALRLYHNSIHRLNWHIDSLQCRLQMHI